MSLDVQFISKQRIEGDSKKGILVISYLIGQPKYSVHLFNLFQKYKTYIIAFTYDRPHNTISLKRHADGTYPDLFRISGLEKTYYAHEKSFTATVERISTEVLYT